MKRILIVVGLVTVLFPFRANAQSDVEEKAYLSLKGIVAKSVFGFMF